MKGNNIVNAIKSQKGLGYGGWGIGVS